MKDEIYEDIKQKIIVGHYRPGDLLNEQKLMSEYKIGQTPLREVFFRLQDSGLIRRYARIGTIVAPIDTKRINDIAEIRLYFEEIVAKLAVQRISGEALAAMGVALQKLEDAVRESRHDSFAAEQTKLHSMLYAAAGNRALKEFIDEQYSLFARVWYSVDRGPIDMEGPLKDWQDIYQALCDKDEEKAVASNKKHFEKYLDRLKSMR